jgi:hypothetical protein
MKGAEGTFWCMSRRTGSRILIFPLTETSAHLTNMGGDVWAVELNFDIGRGEL